ncbi:hypothetical protein J437_LFUL006326 [Ladona fulva]|uniref:BMERB domain-containing protein n=1 Tax=Ladona fulva TaxID=123851 RepID=A0A8K0K0Y8_LADFU|nr:hypothetical protein J437_LFUL006326 [Ladona fulva]
MNDDLPPGMLQLSPVRTTKDPQGGGKTQQNQLLTRQEELRERARQLLDAARKETLGRGGISLHHHRSLPSGKNEEERQQQLRERARRLIAEARMGVVGSPTSPLSPVTPLSPSTPAQTPHSPSHFISNLEPTGNKKVAGNLRGSRSPSVEADDIGIERKGGESIITRGNDGETVGIKKPSPLRSFSSIVDRISPDKSPQDAYFKSVYGKDEVNYIQNELEALEREQNQIDQQAAILEKELRNIMSLGSEREREDVLMAEWFTLVNKKNALLRRQMQLNILEKEDDLERRFELLNRELRSILSMEDWQKTEEQKVRENLLLDELVSIVNKRDELIHQLDSQEKAIEDDDEIERDLNRAGIAHRNRNCVLQ